MGVRTYEGGYEPPAPRRGPSWGAAVGLAGLLLVLLLFNGRPIGQAGDDGLMAALAWPAFALARLFVELDETGRALVGKLVSSLLTASAAGALFLAIGRRHPSAEARGAAFVLALGTSLWSASQLLSAEAAAAFGVAVALLFVVRADEDPRWAGRAGLPLGLAAAVQPLGLGAVLALTLGVVVRWPKRLPWLVLWLLPGALLLAAELGLGPFALPALAGPHAGATLAPWRGASWPSTDDLGLLLSPARGALVFVPAALVAALGLLSSLPAERGLALSCGLAVLAHGAVLASAADWQAGVSWGPRLLGAAWPALFLFLPEGLRRLPGLGVGLVAASVAVQALGAFAYDGRWDVLNRPRPGQLGEALWDVKRSPILFQLKERVLRVAIPAVEEGRAVVREHPLVLGGATGSRVGFDSEGPVVTGSDAVLGDVFLEGGARPELARLQLARPGDGLFLRVREGARARRLELRVAGRGRGTLSVGEKTFWTVPRFKDYPVSGAFRLRHPYYYPDSGGADVRVALRGPGRLEIEHLALVPPGEPENVIRLP